DPRPCQRPPLPQHADDHPGPGQRGQPSPAAAPPSTARLQGPTADATGAAWLTSALVVEAPRRFARRGVAHPVQVHTARPLAMAAPIHGTASLPHSSGLRGSRGLTNAVGSAACTRTATTTRPS